MPTSERVALALAGLALAIAGALLGLVLQRVHGLEAGELEAASDVITPSGTDAPGAVRLLTAELEEGDEVTFELCSSSRLEPSVYGSLLGTAILRVGPEGDEEVVRGPLEAGVLENARRSRAGTCVDVGRGVIEVPGTYATELTWSAALPEDGVRFRSRTLARRSLEVGDRNEVFAILVLVLLAAVALYVRPLRRVEDERPLRVALALAAASAMVLWFFMAVVTPMLPRGSAWGLVSGVVLALVELALALAFAGAARLDVLGIGRLVPEATTAEEEGPYRGSGQGRPPSAARRAAPYLLLALSPIFGVLLYRIAQIALRVVPSTGEAPIEAFVAWPSGMLSFAALAVVAPLAEEIFFRGMVYGVLAGRATDLRSPRVLGAALGSWLVFAAVHLPQTWGSWGGMLSIAIAALGFTLLRAASGSVVVPAVAHLVYNGLLSAQGLMAS